LRLQTFSIMSEDWDQEMAEEVPAPVEAVMADVKLFGKWSTEEVQVGDISLQDYIACKVYQIGCIILIQEQKTLNT